MKDFDGRIAVITGAGSGIGQSLAVQLAERGCVLALGDLDAEGLARTKERVGKTSAICSMHKLDVADRNAVEAFAADVIERHGSVHLLFNNAGVTLVDTVQNVDYDDFNWLMNINFWGVVYGTKAFLPHLRKAADEAHIINISSLFGLLSLPLQSAYNASKFAVRGFTEALKMELAGSAVGVSCVHPGGIKTGIARNSRVRAESLDVSKEELNSQFDKAARTTPDQAAAKTIRGVEKNRRRILIGPDAKIADWIVRLFPGSYEKIMRFEVGVRRKARLQSSVRAG